MVVVLPMEMGSKGDPPTVKLTITIPLLNLVTAIIDSFGTRSAMAMEEQCRELLATEMHEEDTGARGSTQPAPHTEETSAHGRSGRSPDFVSEPDTRPILSAEELQGWNSRRVTTQTLEKVLKANAEQVVDIQKANAEQLVGIQPAPSVDSDSEEWTPEEIEAWKERQENRRKWESGELHKGMPPEIAAKFLQRIESGRPPDLGEKELREYVARLKAYTKHNTEEASAHGPTPKVDIQKARPSRATASGAKRSRASKDRTGSVEQQPRNDHRYRGSERIWPSSQVRQRGNGQAFAENIADSESQVDDGHWWFDGQGALAKAEWWEPGEIDRQIYR